jgi:broad-specificity NMP kinase
MPGRTRWDRGPHPGGGRGYSQFVITAVLGAPGSGKSAVAPLLRSLLPSYVIVDWDEFMAPAAALAGRDIRSHRDTWPAYRQLVRTLLGPVAQLPVVLLTGCTPDELPNWPISSWVLLDCSDRERQQRLAHAGRPGDIPDAVTDAAQYRALGLPAIDTTERTPGQVAGELAQAVQLPAAT